MAKYTGITQGKDGSWSYRIKKKVNGQVVDTRIKKDENGLPFLTARAAHEAKLKHEAKLASGEIEIAPKSSKTTLQAVYDAYLESADAKQKAPATLRKQESMWRNHVGPKFGDTDINAITIPDLDTFLFELYQKRSFKYTEGFLKFFYLLFGFAYKLEVIDGDRYYRMFGDKSTRLTMPVMEQADVEKEMEGAETYDDDQLAVMEKIFQSEDGNLLTAFYLGVYCGLRISECFALRWSNINWEDGTITINRQMHNTGGQITLTKVKTMTAIRTVMMPSFLQDYLDSYYQTQRQERIRAGQHYKNTERVYDDVSREWIVGGDFINRRTNGELLTVNSMKYWSRKIKSEVGIDFKFHNLRHTYATNCAYNNVNMMLLMQMMGHKKLETTKEYYMKIDVKRYKDKTMHLLDTLYDFHGRTPEDKPPADFVETIDSKGRRTKYIK